MGPELNEGAWHRTTFSEKMLTNFSSDIPEVGKTALKLLEERDIRFHFIINHLQANGSSCYFELDEEESGPLVKMVKVSYDFVPNADYGENPHFCGQVSFESTLLIAALKSLQPGLAIEVSGFGTYSDPKFISKADIHLKSEISSEKDRIIFSLIVAGKNFGSIDAGKNSQEEIYKSFYDQQIEEYIKARSSN